MIEGARAEIQAFALEVARRAARNIGGTVPEVLRRFKSRAYLYGKVRRRFPDKPEGELRDVLDGLRHAELEPEDLAGHVHARKPAEGREPLESEVWAPRARALTELVSGPLDVAELLCRAAALGPRWERNFTLQVLAAAETTGSLEYKGGRWRRHEPAEAEPEDTTMTTKATPKPAPSTTTAAAPSPTAPFTPNEVETPEEEARRLRRNERRREWQRGKRAARASTSTKTTAAAASPEVEAEVETAITALVRRVVRTELARLVGNLLGAEPRV